MNEHWPISCPAFYVHAGQPLRPVSSRDLHVDGLDAWILSNLDDTTLRRRRVSRLTPAARPFRHPGAELLLTLGHRHSANVR